MKTVLAVLVALGTLGLVLSCAPNGAEVLRRHADEAFAAGDYRRAIELYSQAIAAGSGADGVPAMAELFAARGRAHLEAGDPRAAQADLRSAIDLDQDHAEAHLSLCLLLVESEGGETALPACLRAAKLGRAIPELARPQLEAALGRLAEAAYASADYESFLSRHEELAVLSPAAAVDAFAKSRLADSHFQLAERLLADGATAAAVEHYRAAVGFVPQDLYRRRAASALSVAAAGAEARRDYGEAVAYYEQALDFAGGRRREIESKLEQSRRLERCYGLKNSGDSALSRIDWPLVERANDILGPVNRGMMPLPDDAQFIQSNAAGLAESVTALLAATEAYRSLMNAGCPGEVVDDALRANVNLILSWAVKADAITEFLVNRMKEKREQTRDSALR
jgi:tetratricopeptide (TPR) repeat protein